MAGWTERLARVLRAPVRARQAREEARLLQDLAEAHRARPWDAGVRLQGAADIQFLSERGTVGLVQIKRAQTRDELKALVEFARRGGKLVCLPMYAGVPADAYVPALLASGYTSPEPPRNVRAIPHIGLGDMDFHAALHRCYPGGDKQVDFVNCTWAANLREKRWDLAVDLVERLCDRHTMALVIYHNAIPARDRSRLAPYVRKGTLFLHEKPLPKEEFSALLRAARVGIVHSEWDARPRYLDQLLLSDVPVVLNARIYGGRQFVEHGSGEVVAPDRLADAAEDMLAHPDRYTGMRARYLSERGPYNAARRLTAFLNGLLGADYRVLVPAGAAECYRPDYIRRHAAAWAEPGEFLPEDA